MVWVVALRIAALDQPAFPGASYDVVGDANEERSLLAAGKDVNVVGHRLGPTPRGPGNKCRDDSSKYGRWHTILRVVSPRSRGPRVHIERELCRERVWKFV